MSILESQDNQNPTASAKVRFLENKTSNTEKVSKKVEGGATFQLGGLG